MRPRYAVADIGAQLWRDRLLVLAVFAVIFVIGAALALSMPKTYTASSNLLVKLGQEYVYEPRSGDAARGAIPKLDEVVQSEAAILGSAELKRRVIRTIGMGPIDAKLAQQWQGATDAEREKLEASAVKILTDGLEIRTAPETGVVALSFEHKRPDSAALILNKLVEGYLVYRREVFRDVTTPLLETQRQAFELRLDGVDAQYETFLRTHGVGNFETQRTALSTAYQNAFDEKRRVEVSLAEVNGRLATLRAEMARVPTEIAIQRDLNLSAPDRLLTLRVERQDLLSRYTPDSQPVREHDAKIRELEQFIASGRAVGDKERRLGANPVWQSLETDRVRLEAEQTSLTSRRDVLAAQLADLTERQLRLTALESDFQNLAGERDVLQTGVRTFTARESESRAAGELASAGADNIVVIEQAAPPSRGSSLKRPLLVLALLFAGFTALCAGLLRLFLRPGYPTPASAARTLDLPVLAAVPVKAR